MARTLAAVFAHPDDESLFAGGLLAASAASGAGVRLLCLTRGERGWSRFGERGEALAQRRSRELGAACRALGIDVPVQLDLPDGALGARADVAARIAAWLREVQPDVLVTFGPDGAYGHADHVACARAVHHAARARPALRVLETCFDPGTFDAARRALERFVDADALPVPASELGCASTAAELHLSLDDALREAKRAAVACHDSQLPGGDPDRLLAPGLLATLSVQERYRVASGPALPDAGATEAFAGLV